MTFVIAFGVAFQSLLASHKNFSFKVLIDVFNNAYWAVYGELTLLDKINSQLCIGNDNDFENPCLDELSASIAFILLMIYMIVASVLLVDLLIAMVR